MRPSKRCRTQRLGPHGVELTSGCGWRRVSLLFTNNVLVAFHKHRIAIVGSTRVRAAFRLRTFTQDPHNGGRWNEAIAHASQEDEGRQGVHMEYGQELPPAQEPVPHPRWKGLLSNSEHTVSIWRSAIVHGRRSALLRCALSYF